MRKAEVATHATHLPAPEPPEELAEPQTPSLDADALLARRWPPYERLPASAEGRVALPIASGDGTRNHPNLTVRVVDLETLSTTSEIVLLAPNEWEGARPEELRARVTARAERAQRALDEGGFTAMTLAYEADRPGAEPITANAAGLTLHWDATTRTLRVVDEASGEERLRRVVAEPATTCPRAPSPELLAAWIDTDANVLVARIAHPRAEACARPDDRWLVLPLSPLPEEDGEE